MLEVATVASYLTTLINSTYFENARIQSEFLSHIFSRDVIKNINLLNYDNL